MILNLPLFVTMPRKKGPGKRWSLNLNEYRNAKHFTLNDAKKAYKNCVWDAYVVGNRQGLMIEPPLRLTYTIYPKTNRAFDVANIASVIDKFASDALVAFKVLPDDNFRYLPEVVYRFGGVDRENPRCELEIESIGG